MGWELCLSSAYYQAGKGNPDCISQGLYDLVGIRSDSLANGYKLHDIDVTLPALIFGDKRLRLMEPLS
jgi:hypothetical protein